MSRAVETVGSREVTELTYPSSDGRRIPAVLSMPTGDGPFPVVVTIHGGRGNRDLAFIRTLAVPGGISPTVTMLNEQPWAVLAVSYRAGGGAVLGMEQDDVVAGIRFAKTLPRVDPARVGVLGGSRGGHLALRAAEVMGREMLCVAAGSPWMTNPRVYLFGKPVQPCARNARSKQREHLRLDVGGEHAAGGPDAFGQPDGVVAGPRPHVGHHLARLDAERRDGL
jgi:poly(3-hydroxybutyrate) depolymerase